MSRVQQRAKTVVSFDSRSTPPESAPSPTHPLYGVALLKLALELKKHPEARVEEVIEQVLLRMRLPADDFRSFLAKEGGILKVLSEKVAAKPA